jgi:type II secretory pathway component GspD/PulD (secretin)
MLAGPAGAAEVELYKARNRPAAELADVVGPLMGTDGVAVSDDSGGFVLLRGTAEAVAQARQLLATLDVAPRQYRISSELVSHSVLQARGIRVGGWIQVGDLRVGRSLSGPEGVRVAANQLDATSGRRFQATVVALENTPAEIWTGNVFPVSVTRFDDGGRHREHRRGGTDEITAWMPVRQGLRVRARPAGNAVDLELVPVVEDGNPDSGIRERGASTRVRIARGEQLVIGSLGRADSLGTGDPLAHAVEEDLSEDLILVRVDEID